MSACSYQNENKYHPEWHRILFDIVYMCKNLHSDPCFAPERFGVWEIYFWIAQFSLYCGSLTRWIIVTEMIKEAEPAVSLKNGRFLYKRALYSLFFFILLFLLWAGTIGFSREEKWLVLSFYRDANYFDNCVYFMLLCKGLIKQYTSCW